MKTLEQTIQQVAEPLKRKLPRAKSCFLRQEVFNLVWLYAKERDVTFGVALEELVKKGLFAVYHVKPPPED
jgi:hypothetical protein